jgi:MoaA/NifB/PqqE/SkfB family radical SAM enzyme
VRGVDLLRTVPTRLLLKHPTSTMTQDHVDAIREWCTARGLPHIFSFEVENRHDGGQAPAVYRIESRRVKALTDHVQRARGLPTPSAPLPECTVGDAGASADRLYKCGAGRLGFFVDGRGNASHCVLDRDPVFPLLERPWDEVWSAIGEWVNQPLPEDAPCSGCSLRGGCHNCPARSRNATGSPFLKDTYHCDVTHAAHGLPPAQHTDPRLTASRPLGACAR